MTKTQCVGMITQFTDPGNNLDVEVQKVAADDGVALKGNRRK